MDKQIREENKMKTLKRIFQISCLLGLILVLESNTTFSQVRVGVSFNLFYDALRPHGSWFEFGSYGYCWRPNFIKRDWRPYMDGHWVWSDYGWTWVSDYDWGWAPFHYGRWVNDDYYGWIWIPDYEWGPAWVQWRSSDEYIGWAPLPPRVQFGIRIGSDYDDYGVHYRHWNFVHCKSFLNIHFDFFPIHRHYNIFHRTKNITMYDRINNHVFNHGPEIRHIEKQSGRRVTEYRLIENREYSRDRNYRAEKNDLHVYRPEMNRGSGSTRTGETNTGINRNSNTPVTRDQGNTRQERNTEIKRNESRSNEQVNRNESRPNREDRNSQNQRNYDNRNDKQERKPEIKNEERKSDRETSTRSNERESRSKETVNRSSERKERDNSRNESRGNSGQRNESKNERSRR
jgi:hypothetical protein